MSKKPSKTSRAAAPSKGEKILKLLKRNTGSTIAELAKATGWQEHSVRGFMSGTLKKKQGLEINTPDVKAFRDYAQKVYLASDQAKDWPKGMLEKIGALN